MYYHVRRTLLKVGRQMTLKLCDNSKNYTTIIDRCPVTVSHSMTNHLVFQRTYCNKDTGDTDDTKDTNGDVPTLVPVNVEALRKLTEFRQKPENERIYKIIELEIEFLRQSNEKVPSSLKPIHWWELLQLDSRNRRRRYLEYLFKLEKKTQNRIATKERNKKLKEEEPPSESKYGLGRNSMFLRIYDSSMAHMWNGRLINAMLYGQPLVLDCSYDSHMTRREMKYCSKQLMLSFAANRIHDEPFNMYLCNTNNSGELMTALHRYIPPLYDADFPLNVKTESYLDIFDKERLVYLTPHCNEEMLNFDYDAVYIIGGFVDKSTNEPVSMAKAKKEGIKMMKLPLDRYLEWGSSSGKNLTINSMVSILLDIRRTGSWEKALEHVPRRKLYDFRRNSMERKLRTFFDRDALTSEPKRTIDDESFTTQSNPPTPLQPRHNEMVRQEFQKNSFRPYRKRYNQDRTPEYRRDQKSSSDLDMDFSMEGRMKKNYKN